MKKTLNAIALSAALALGLVAGASVAEAGVPARDMALVTGSAASGPVVDVQYRHHWRHHYRHHRYGRHYRHYRGGTSLYFGFGSPYYHRPYYTPPPVYVRPRYVAPAYRGGLSSAHVRWCYDRYRSYRASDNTYQPYNGPRRQCYSPYS